MGWFPLLCTCARNMYMCLGFGHGLLFWWHLFFSPDWGSIVSLLHFHVILCFMYDPFFISSPHTGLLDYMFDKHCLWLLIRVTEMDIRFFLSILTFFSPLKPLKRNLGSTWVPCFYSNFEYASFELSTDLLITGTEQGFHENGHFDLFFSP